jgi:DME family drug/metabolite transporter
LGSPIFALGGAAIWAITSIYYRGFLSKFDFLNFNLLRTSVAATALAIPAVYFWGSNGLGFAALSGVITLACGDSFFLLSLRDVGASVASPVSYTYVLMIQFLGAAVGQAIPLGNFAAAAMVIVGVYLLSKGGGGRRRPKGIALAICAAIVWTIGQELVQTSTNAGANFVVIAFTRDSSAALALAVAVLLTRKARPWPSGLTRREYGIICGFMFSDLAVGSSMFVYSISTIGVALTVILSSLSPLLTQVFAKALGKESPSAKDFAGGALIVAALILAVAA